MNITSHVFRPQLSNRRGQRICRALSIALILLLVWPTPSGAALRIATVGAASPSAAQRIEQAANMRRISLKQLQTLAEASKEKLWSKARGEHQDVKLYLHWSGMHYGAFYEAYHLNIDANGDIYASTDDLSETRNHTYMRNTGSIGISLACCSGAKPGNLGAEPPTDQQIDKMAHVVAVLARTLSVPIDIDHVLTHGEAGDNDDHYFPPYEDNGRPYGMYGQNHSRERWDLAILKDGDAWGSGGRILRAKAKRYLAHPPAE